MLPGLPVNPASTKAARLATALARTLGALSEQRCARRAMHTCPQAAGSPSGLLAAGRGSQQCTQATIQSKAGC